MPIPPSVLSGVAPWASRASLSWCIQSLFSVSDFIHANCLSASWQRVSVWVLNKGSYRILAIPLNRRLVESRKDGFHLRTVFNDFDKPRHLALGIYVSHPPAGWHAGLESQRLAALLIGGNVAIVILATQAKVMKTKPRFVYDLFVNGGLIIQRLYQLNQHVPGESHRGGNRGARRSIPVSSLIAAPAIKEEPGPYP